MIDYSKIKPINTVGDNQGFTRLKAKPTEECTPEEIQERIKFWEGRLEEMDHYEMAHLYRFATSEHPVFDKRYTGLFEKFIERFNEFGGWTPEISKKVGWDK